MAVAADNPALRTVTTISPSSPGSIVPLALAPGPSLTAIDSIANVAPADSATFLNIGWCRVAIFRIACPLGQNPPSLLRPSSAVQPYEPCAA